MKLTAAQLGRLQSLADELGLSPWAFARYVMKEYGRPPGRLTTDQADALVRRLEAAVARQGQEEREHGE